MVKKIFLGKYMVIKFDSMNSTQKKKKMKYHPGLKQLNNNLNKSLKRFLFFFEFEKADTFLFNNFLSFIFILFWFFGILFFTTVIDCCSSLWREVQKQSRAQTKKENILRKQNPRNRKKKGKNQILYFFGKFPFHCVLRSSWKRKQVYPLPLPPCTGWLPETLPFQSPAGVLWLISFTPFLVDTAPSVPLQWSRNFSDSHFLSKKANNHAKCSRFMFMHNGFSM